MAVLGAAAGAVAGTVFDYWKDSGERKVYANGYVKGRSDEVKRLYWITKRLNEGEDHGGGLNRGYYELPVAASGSQFISRETDSLGHLQRVLIA